MAGSESTIGALLDETGGSIKTGPFGTKLKASEYTATGVPVISVGEVGFGRLRVHHDTPRVDDTVSSRMPEYLLKAGDIVFSRKGAVERSAQVQPDEDGYFLGSDGIRIRLNVKECDPKFISYQLQTTAHRSWMIQHAAGTTMPSLNEGIIRRIPIVLKPLAEQKAIAAVLGALDDKIELNRRMNATLEEMARALFQSWFVDFDPVRAKLDGREPVGLDPAIAALFPESFDGSAVGQIPNGWSIKPVGEVVDCVGGGTPSTAEPIYWEGGTHHWTTPKDFSSLQAPVLLDTDRKLTDAGIAKISSGLLPAGTLLLSSRAPVGYLAITAMPVAINQGFIALKCNGFASNIFMLNWCQTNIAEIKSRATGTTFAEISKQNFRPIPVVLPPIELMAAFTAKAAPLYAQITANLHQSQALANMRDTLLPKLLSGELALPQMATSD
jgi:type I restriction enzyme, S subunit